MAFIHILYLNSSPFIPRPGKCGSGKGPDTWTSGYEGHWTMNPTKWDNEYFQNLFNFTWTNMSAPGFNRTALTDPNNTFWQWHVKDVPFNASDFNASLIMLTSDLAVRFLFFLILLFTIR